MTRNTQNNQLQGGKKRNKRGLLIIAALITVSLFATACGSDKKDDGPKKADSSKTEDTKKEEVKAFAPGETAEYKDVQVTLNNYTESAGSEFNKPTEGNVFVLAEFTITNNSDKEMNVSSMLSFEAYCDDTKTDISLTALLAAPDKQQLDGAVAAGKSLNGVIGYEVPAGWQAMEIRFNSDLFSDKDFIFQFAK